MIKIRISTVPESATDLVALVSNQSQIDEYEWGILERKVNQFHNNFAVKLRRDYLSLSEDDVRIILLLRIGMSHIQIARLTHVLMSSFRMRRSRLKKKMNVKCSSISDFIRNLYR